MISLHSLLFLPDSYFIWGALFLLGLFHGPTERAVTVLNLTVFLQVFDHIICVFGHEHAYHSKHLEVGEQPSGVGPSLLPVGLGDLT